MIVNKAVARYWTVEAGGETVENAAWCYEQPKPEAIGIAGRICFFDEQMELVAGDQS